MRELNLSPDDLDALARITYAEARGEPFHGQLAVADVVLNRAVAGRGWPSSVQGVIQQRNQFEPLRNRSSWRELPAPSPEFASALTSAVQQRASGQRPDASNGATFFLNPTITNQRGTHFASRVDPTAAIGRHAFYSATNRDPRPISIPEHRLNLQLSAEASANSSAPTAPTPMSDRTFGGYQRHLNQLPSVNWNNIDRSQLDPEVASRLDRLQNNVPFPISVRSGFRSPTHNASVGGARGSEHVQGRAVDLSLANLDEEQRRLLVATASGPDMFNRVGAYSGNTGLHLDMRPQRSPDGSAWPMFDSSRANVAQAPGWFSRGLADGSAMIQSQRENAQLSASVDPELARSLGLDAPSHSAATAVAQSQRPTPVATRPPTPRQPTVAATAAREPLSQSELQRAYPEDLAQSVTDATYGRFSSLVTNENLSALFPDLSRREATGIGIGLASL